MVRLLTMLAIVLSVSLHAQSKAPATQAASVTTCAATVSNGLDIGGRPSRGTYSNGSLSVGVWPNGVVPFVDGGPGFRTPDGALGTKFGWRRGVAGPLTIHGRRLDAAAPPLRAHIPAGYGTLGFQATYVIFPTVGCWEVTGRVADTSLTVIMSVTLTGTGPRAVLEL